MNDLQKEAVEHDGAPLIIFAPPGSGKTHVISMKIKRLVEMGVDASTVLALSFTNKAAAELKERIAALTGQPAADFVGVSTFHSLCLRILRRFGSLGRFSIMEPMDATKLMKECIRSAMSAINADTGVDDDELEQHIYTIINHDWRNHAIEPLEVVIGCNVSKDIEVVAQSAYIQYRNTCTEQRAVDFDDLLTLTVTLLRDHPGVAKHVRSKEFLHLLVDEFQDTNPAQMKLVHLLVGRTVGGRLIESQDEGELLNENNLTVVGDDYQAIYKFRGSTVSNIIDFTQMYPTAKRIILSINYRSSQDIIDTSSALIAKNVGQVHKTVKSGRPASSVIKGEVIKIQYSTARYGSEIYAEAQTLVKLLREDADAKVAVLTRVNMRECDPIPMALRAAGIVYRIHGRGAFFDKPEVRSAVSLFAFVAGGGGRDLYKSLPAFCPGIGPKTLQRIMSHRAEGEDLLIVCQRLSRTPNKSKKIGALASQLGDLALLAPDSPSHAAVSVLVERLHGLDDQQRANVLLLVEMARSHGGNLGDFVDHCRLNAPAHEVPDEEKPNCRVEIMTAHRSKGLEFPIVFIPGCVRGQFPFSFRNAPVDVEEERRLFFVAMTRAKDRLYVSVPGNSPSVFVDEFNAKVVVVRT